jgi:hypothetical protein
VDLVDDGIGKRHCLLLDQLKGHAYDGWLVACCSADCLNSTT